MYEFSEIYNLCLCLKIRIWIRKAQKTYGSGPELWVRVGLCWERKKAKKKGGKKGTEEERKKGRGGMQEEKKNKEKGEGRR